MKCRDCGRAKGSGHEPDCDYLAENAELSWADLAERARQLDGDP